MVELDVKGMTCGRCVDAVTQAVKDVDPQGEVNVDLAAKRVRVEGASSPERLIRALDAAGYPAAPASAMASAAATRTGCCCG